MQEEDDAELLAWLKAGRDSDEEQDEAAFVAEFLNQMDAGSQTLSREEALDALGVSPTEKRRQLRRPKDNRKGYLDKYKKTIVRQFQWWIENEWRVDWSESESPRSHVVATWVTLTNYDLDLAKRWWKAGVHPLDLELMVSLEEYDIKPPDLAQLIGSRTLIEHLRRGTSLEWCIRALRWHRPRRGA